MGEGFTVELAGGNGDGDNAGSDGSWRRGEGRGGRRGEVRAAIGRSMRIGRKKVVLAMEEAMTMNEEEMASLGWRAKWRENAEKEERAEAEVVMVVGVEEQGRERWWRSATRRRGGWRWWRATAKDRREERKKAMKRRAMARRVHDTGKEGPTTVASTVGSGNRERVQRTRGGRRGRWCHGCGGDKEQRRKGRRRRRGEKERGGRGGEARAIGGVRRLEGRSREKRREEVGKKALGAVLHRARLRARGHCAPRMVARARSHVGPRKFLFFFFFCQDVATL